MSHFNSLLCSARVLGSIWFKHFAKARKRKAPENILYINRGGLKPENLILPPYKGAVKKMNKYSLISVIVISINITVLLITLFYNNPIENFTINSEYINVQVKFISNKH